MGRPLSATDDEILAAAAAVFWRRGYGNFSVSEVAKQVGLSRAAINLRFNGAQGLQRAVLGRMADDFEDRLRACDAPPGGAGLMAIAELVGRMAGDRANLASAMTIYHAGSDNPDVVAFEQRRGEILFRAIAAVMPATAVDTPDAVSAFMAHLAGSLLAWQASTSPDAVSYLRDRTALWIRMVGIAVPCPG